MVMLHYALMNNMEKACLSVSVLFCLQVMYTKASVE